jgi:molecular chaperone DnaK
MDPVRANAAAVGIDLGTSNTVVAHFAVAEGGAARALTDDLTRDPLIPSVCAFHPSGAVLVGREAKERRLQDPKNTIFSTKRLIGRPWGSKEIAQARARLPYELRQGKNSSVLVVARNKEYTLPEVSAFVLRKAKTIAEVSLRRKVDRAVITCPANFDDLQRGATKLAGRLAGLEVLRVLNEPTAAALAYGYGKEGQERILVYDFGGGTFDVSLLEREGDFFQVRATAGDSYLGGDDVDAAIANRIAEGFAAKHFYDPRADKQVFEHVREAAEKLKLKLATEERATIELVDVAFGVGGKSLRFDFAMTRAELGAIADPLIEQTLKVCKRTLDQARIGVRDIDQVLLVGGSTLIARVRQRAAEFFEHEPAAGVSPFEAVAVGAAIQAYAMSDALEDDAGIPTAAALAAARSLASPGSSLAAPIRARPPSLTTGASPRAAPAGLPGSLAVPVPGSVPVAGSPPVAPRFTIEKPAAAAQPRARIGWLAAAVLVAALLVAWLLFR